MVGVVVTLFIFGLAVLISYIVVSGWKQTKADAEAEAGKDFEFVKAIQKKFGFSNYNLWRLCQIYYDEEIIPADERHNPNTVYKLFSFHLAEKFLTSSENENLIEVESGLNCKRLNLAKPSVVEYILNREGLCSIAENKDEFNRFVNRPGRLQTPYIKAKYSFDTTSVEQVSLYCDEHITNPKCLILQMESKR